MKEQEAYDDMAEINEAFRKKAPLSFLIALCIVAAMAGGIYLAVSTESGKKNPLAYDVKPKEGDCGLATDVADIVAKFRLENPTKKVKKTEPLTVDRMVSRCYVQVLIYLEEEEQAPKPATLGYQKISETVAPARKEETIEYANTSLGSWCASDEAGAFTAKVAERLLGDFRKKHAGSREVMTTRIFTGGPGIDTYCILFNKKTAPPKRQRKTTSASAEVFICPKGRRPP